VPSTLTVPLDEDLDRALDEAAKSRGLSRSDLVRDVLRRYLAVRRFEDLRKRIMPFAQAAGYLTDDDVFRDVS
jgi:metal-responsive CopG/Arc/MetJ family transcriptional regulator